MTWVGRTFQNPLVLFILACGGVFLLRALYKCARAMRWLDRVPIEIIETKSVKDSRGDPVHVGDRVVVEVSPVEFISGSHELDVSSTFVPAILTGLGIFGTFWGISEALTNFPEDINNSTQMLAAIQVLIPAMKTAFYTSVWGIGLATLFMLAEKVMVSFITAKASRVVEKLNRRVVEERPALYLRSQWEQREAVSDLRDSVETLRDSVQAVQDLASPEAVARIVGETLDRSIEEHLVPPMEGIRESLSALEEMKVQNRLLQENNERLANFVMDDMGRMVDDLKNTVASTNKAMETTRQGLEATRDALNLQRESLEKFVGEMRAVLAAQEESFRETADFVREEFERVSDRVFSQYEQFNRQISQMGSVFDQVANRFEEMAERSGQLLDAHGDRYREMLESQRTLTEQALSEMLRAIEGSLEAMSQRTTQVLEASVDKAVSAAVALIERAGESFDEVVSRANEELQGTLSRVGEELERTGERVQQELARFREAYTESLREFFHQQKLVLEEQLAGNTERLRAVVDELGEVFSKEYDLRKDLWDNTKDVIARLEAVVARTVVLEEAQKEGVRELAEATLDATRRVTEDLRRSASALSGIQTAVEHVAASIGEDVAEQIEAFARKQAETVRQFQVEVDGHLQEILTQLTSAAEIVAAAVASQLETAA